MSIDLEQFRQQLGSNDPHIHDTLESSFCEAARVMSARSQANYLSAASAIHALGKGSSPALAWLQAMPAVVKEVGEDILEPALNGSMKLSSLVSGEVICLLLDTLPLAARRLGNPDLLNDYLALVHQLAAKAPRGLRPMLGQLDTLFSKLTLGGLRRWALWGVQQHARDLKALVGYFELTSADSQAVLQRERRGTLLIDNQRKLNFYLRALWGRDFFLRATSGDFESRDGYQPWIEQGMIHLPDAYDDYQGISGSELYRASATHAAAHISYSTPLSDADKMSPLQQLMIGLFEDARIERLAIERFPGLRTLWLPFHRQHLTQVSQQNDPQSELLCRLSLALLDDQASENDSLITSLVEAFNHAFEGTNQAQGLAQLQAISVSFGLELCERFSQRFQAFNLRQLQATIAPPYRDDNRFIWCQETGFGEDNEYLPASLRQTRRNVSVIEMVNEIDCELAGDDAEEIWTLQSEFFRDGDPKGLSINQLEGKEPISVPYHYPEWDYQVQLHRPDWVTLLEKPQPKGDPQLIDQILTEHRPLANRIRHIIDALQPQGVIRQRHQEDGDEVDIDAAIRALVDLRLGTAPDSRVNTRYIRKTRDLAVVVLLDLSESTNETLPGSDQTILQLARQATALLAFAIDGIGDPFAIHGFASDGRHDLQYYRFKDFNQPWDDKVKARLSGMRGGLSTRMGGALRHAARQLQNQPQRKKLVLMVTDGEPADIDVRDPQYLRHDTKKAVDELAAKGITSYCLTLDPNADDYVSRIFGSNRYTVVDQVARLPDKLPALFAGLTR